MEKFIYKLYKFMYGRNGADELYKFCLFIYLLILVINIFVNNIYINLVSMLLFLIIMYRFFSKDIYKRKKENDKYLKIKYKVIDKISFVRKKWNDRNTHIYKKCSKCRTILRLPLKKGVHMCKCPKCGNRFKVRCYRNEKIRVEVIKNK